LGTAWGGLTGGLKGAGRALGEWVGIETDVEAELSEEGKAWATLENELNALGFTFDTATGKLRE
jgi:hypothetical protein